MSIFESLVRFVITRNYQAHPIPPVESIRPNRDESRYPPERVQRMIVDKSDQTELDLSNANVGIFEDDMQSWPAAGRLAIDGSVYGTLNVNGEASDAKSRLDWLNLQPLGYRPQPYKQLAKVFLDNGQDSDATAVLVAKEAHMRGQAEVPKEVWQKHLLGINNLLLAFMRLAVGGTLRLTIDYG